MKTGRTITELAMELERQRETKKDLIAPTTLLAMNPELQLEVGNKGDSGVFGINGIGHDQIGTHTGIPSKYYDKMRAEAPYLLANNVNEWFRRYPAKRMVRTLDGQVRAFLSDTYRPLDNADLADAVLPVLLDAKLDIMSCEVTERRLYIKAVDPRIHADVPNGKHMGDGGHTIFDTCSPAVIVSNSEVGMGALAVDSGVYTKACTNMMTIAKAGMRRRHVGSRFGDGEEEIRHLLSDQAKKATDAAVWLRVRDIVKASLDEAVFKAQCEKLGELAVQAIEGDVVKVIDLTAKKLGATEAEGKSFLKHLIGGGDLTRYGVLQAITRAAQDVESYDRATEIEKMGGQIVELPANEWRELAKAA